MSDGPPMMQGAHGKTGTTSSRPLPIETAATPHGPAASERSSPVHALPDLAICGACVDDVRSPFSRRFRYPFTACPQCGPRFGVAVGPRLVGNPEAPAAAIACEACRADYRDPENRRFGDAAISCHACGPRARLIRLDGAAIGFDQFSMLDDVDAAGGLIRKGEIVAIKGLCGYRLACDATNAGAVERLRAGRRTQKPFALMARDPGVIRDYCSVTAEEERLLTSAAAPLVLLAAGGPKCLPEAVAPGLGTLGFMLPDTAMHHMMLRRMDRPVAMTGAGFDGGPPIADDGQARARLIAFTPFALVHDRPLAAPNGRSVIHVVDGRPRVMRRSRGIVPQPIPLPAGFECAPDLLATGGPENAAACLLKAGEAILTQPCGRRENEEATRRLGALCGLFGHRPAALVTGRDPDGDSYTAARNLAGNRGLPLIEAGLHHAHVAACLAENGRPLDAPPVLGIALGGLEAAGDGTWWGGEFLLADYRRCERLGTFKPVSMPGGRDAARAPWRSLYAHLAAELGWPEFAMNFADTDLFAFLQAQPRDALHDAMRDSRTAPLAHRSEHRLQPGEGHIDADRKASAPACERGGGPAALASSCERLVESVAAALGICREHQSSDGEAAARLEAIADEALLRGEDEEYPVAIPMLPGARLPYIEPLGLWRGVLGDLWLKTPASVISARFHRWLINSIAAMAVKLARRSAPEGPCFDTVALSGACFKNGLLLTELIRRLEAENFIVLSHSLVPCDTGGLALGQAAIGAARLIDRHPHSQGNASCASEFPAAS